ncbi:M15 family metallopeptidase [Arenimonas sp.]|nr:M15 family metallopeptidase [Candidatus Parcubacteria bacterium]
MDSTQPSKKSLFLTIITIIIFFGLTSYIVWGEYRIRLSSKKIQELKTLLENQNEAYGREVYNLKGITASSSESFNTLFSSLAKEKRTLEERVVTLDKLNKLDPEILKKYSKVYFLSENYTPTETEAIPSEYILNKNAEYVVHVDVVYFLEQMIDDAKKEGLNPLVVSAYRSFRIQAQLKSRNKVTYGANTANRFVAEQGYSEHQLGTTVDLTNPSVAGASLAFERAKEFVWLQNNAYKYGFILSYPKGNAYYAYEPWHWRFVGKALALHLHNDGISFYNLDQRFIDEFLLHMFDR